MYKFQHKYGFMNIKFTCSTGQCNSENITRTIILYGTMRFTY